MRIAMVSEHASPLAALGGDDAGGQNVHVAALSTALARRGHQVTVYTRRDDRDQHERVPLAAGVEVVQVPAGPAAPIPKDELLPHMPAMARWIGDDWMRRGRPDVVHAHFWMSALAVRLATRDLPDPPAAVVTFHALGAVKRRHQGPADTSPPERLAVERDLLRELDAVVATCRDEVAELLALGAEPDRLHVVPCGVDLEAFTARGPHRTPWRPGVLRLLSLGRLVERKGLDTLLEALAELPDAELVVAGGPGPDELDGDPQVQRLRVRAGELGVCDQVRLLGRVSRQDAAALLRAADLLMTVPWYEPFGIVPLEAMACGTPVVASAVGGMLDTVEDGVTGVLVPPRDATAIVDAVHSLTGQPVVLHRAGRAGAERVAARYSWARVAADTEAVYDQLLAPVTSVTLPDPVTSVTLPDPERHPAEELR